MAHEERLHAKLSASGASRWLNCTASPTLEAKFPEKGSEFASEGTTAHELAESYLRERLFYSKDNCELQAKRQADIRQSKYYSDDMLHYCLKYTDFVCEEFAATKQTCKDAVILIEHRVNLQAFIEDGFGTCDAIIIADGVMKVIDLKFGKGVKVSADDNSQLKLYALGAVMGFDLIYNVKKVKLIIHQPRLDSISEYSLSVDELINWGETFVKPRAKEAYEGKGTAKAGSWCKFCRANPTCKELANYCLNTAKTDFSDPALLTDDELIQAYRASSIISDWLDNVAEYMADKAINEGKQWEGLKLVESRTNRKWSDENAVFVKLQKAGYPSTDITNIKIKGIGDIEKVVGKDKFEPLLGALVIKPEGKPVLVDVSDKRPLYNKLEQAKNDFL